MRIIIIGCGRVGARLANALHAQHAITIVDINANAFHRLSQQFSGTTVEGNGIDVDLLREAGTPSADAFVAVTDGDNRNLMAAQIASSIFGVQRVIARVYDPVRAATYGEHGIHTMSPTITGSQRLFDKIFSTQETN
jgi:trk system potassium uptake protein TrkA